MLPAAEERTPALTSGEEIFSLAAGVDLAALDMHQGAREAQGKKLHQGNFSKNDVLRVGEISAKWSGTHQDRKCSWSKTVSGSALDANGNTLSDPSGKSYSWDFENRLTQAVVPGTGTTTFKYDPFGRRIQKSGPLGTINYLYDGQWENVIEEVDNAGNILARYSQDVGLDFPLAEFSSGAASYYEQDGVNSITSLSNGTGALANSYTFDSFGKLTASTGTLTNPFQYTAREFDPETGIYDYRHRYYDPNVGRFISEDPLGFKGGDPNFYGYVLNSPTELIDPLGLQHTPGGPYHPPGRVACKQGLNRTQGDSCDVIMAKMTEIAITLASHALWDWEHGGQKHSTSDLYSWQGAFSKCLAEFLKWCVNDDCPNKKNPNPPVEPWVPPFPIPDPFPFIIDPCVLNPRASYCPGPQA